MEHPPSRFQGEASGEAATMEERRAAMLQRLAQRQEERLQAQAAAREKRSVGGIGEGDDNADLMSARFKELIQLAHAELDALRGPTGRYVEAGDVRPSEAAAQDAIAEAEAFCCHVAHKLPVRDLEQMQSHVTQLRRDLEGLRKAPPGQKKFGFKSKKVTPEAAKPSNPQTSPSEGSTNRSFADASATAIAADEGHATAAAASASSINDPKPVLDVGSKAQQALGGKNKILIGSKDGEGIHLDLRARDSSAGSPELVLSSLTHCTVHIQGVAASLFARDLTGCHVEAGPVMGPCHLTGVQGGTVSVACHQLRVHDCTNTELRVRTDSKPILENCTGIKLGPYEVPAYDGAEVDMATARLEQDTRLWREPRDLSWLRQTPSPNWALLE